MKPEKCPKCEGKIIMIEYSLTDPNHYDGISEYACNNSLSPEGRVVCDYRIGRWCGRKLKENEVERRFCVGLPHPIII